MLLPLLIKPLAVPLTMNRIVLISSQGRCSSSAYYKGIYLARDCLGVFTDCLEFGSLVFEFLQIVWELDQLCMTSVHLDRTKWFDYHVIVVIRELHRDVRVSYLQLSRLLSCFLNRVN